jgi:hypothetical protein
VRWTSRPRPTSQQKTTTPIGLVDPAGPAHPRRPACRRHPANPTALAHQAHQARSTGPADPAHPQHAAGRTVPAGPAGPRDLADPARTRYSAERRRVADPADSTGQAGPRDLADPARTRHSAERRRVADPADSTGLADSMDPHSAGQADSMDPHSAGQADSMNRWAPADLGAWCLVRLGHRADLAHLVDWPLPVHLGRTAARTYPARVAALPEPANPAHQEHQEHQQHLGHREHPVAAASRHPTNSPGSARSADPERGHPMNSAEPMPVAAQQPERPERTHPARYPAGRQRRTRRTRHTRRRGRRGRTRSACRSARWGRNVLGRKDSGRRRAARKGSPDYLLADRCPRQPLTCRAPPASAAQAQMTYTSARQPRSIPAVPPAAGRVPSARLSLRPARRHRTVAGPDRRWPRWSPNRPSGSRTFCPAEDLAREPVTVRTGACDRRGRLTTVPTPDVIPYQGWTHGWTCSELDLSTQNRASSTIRDARPAAGRPGRRVLCVTARMPGWDRLAVSWRESAHACRGHFRAGGT